MLRVSIVGCGKIADQHAEQISRTPECTLVGVCDREELMAAQLQERFNVPQRFTDVIAMIESARPDVVHITTPPQTHYPIGRLCLDAGCHVYIEKPFTIDLAEASSLIALAQERKLQVTVGHNAQFSHIANRMRELVSAGFLGGRPVHLESYYCYDLSDAGYAKALLSDRQHWVRSLPGGLLHNTISHGVSKVAEFLEGESPHVVAYGYTSPLLRSIGESGIVDELRVIIHDGATSAYFTFSSQMRPSMHGLRLYGPKNGLIVDENQQTILKVEGRRRKSYLEQFLPPWGLAKQSIANSLGNIGKFLRADFHAGYGMKCLIQRFYGAIVRGEAPPIPYREILQTARIMDEIFRQIGSTGCGRGRNFVGGTYGTQIIRGHK